jgi:hypothetical protein
MLEFAIALLALGALIGWAATALVYREMLAIQAKRLDLARYEAGEWQKRNELVSALLNAMLRMERQRRRGFALDPPDGSGLPTVLRRVK